MTPTEALRHHQNLCDELHQLALEENRFLKQNQRVPDAALLEKKRALLVRLDESLSAIKAGNAANTVASPATPARPDPARSEIIEKSRAKLLQILHLDRENEQLLLRYSLGVRANRPVQNTPAPTPAPAPSTPTHLQRLYDRHR
jgi:hypothetical protein